MLLRFFVLLIIFCCPFVTAAADWGSVGDAGSPVNLEADELSYDKESGLYRASGNVHLTQDEIDVRSQILWWNQVSGEIEAEGAVELTTPNEQMSGSKVRYNLQTGTGVVEDGQVFLREQNLYVKGSQIERRGEFDYRIKEGTFTTCDGDVPSWKFGADQLDVTIEGYARAKNAVFYLKDIPSFYVPYILYPIKTERESGFLMPQMGTSERRGFQLNSAYYQVLGRNQDATFYLDYLSDMGLGKGLEYRYIFGRGNAGEARVYHIDVDKIDGEKVDEERYALEWQHAGELPGGVRMVVDGLYVNDDDYFQDFGEVAEEYNRDKVQSIFSLSKGWGKYNLVGQFKYTKDLEFDDKTTLQLLPRVSFDAARQRIGETVFYYNLISEYTNFWRDETVPEQNRIRGQRLMVRPSLSASLQLFDVVSVAPEVAYRERFYWGLSDDSDAEQDGIVEFSTKLTTRFQRVYEQPIGPADKLRHSIEPEVTYLYTPDQDQSHLPSFDSADRIDYVNRVDYALVQRFTARFDPEEGAPTYRDLAYLRLSQSYDLRDREDEEDFSAIRAELNLLPTDWAWLELDSSFDIDQGEWSKVTAETGIRDQRGNALRASYSKDSDEDLEYASLQLDVAFLKPVYLTYETRYDLDRSKSLEDVVGIEYRQQCWSALLSFRENDIDRSFMLTFTMKGIGPVGGVGGNLGGI